MSQTPFPSRNRPKLALLLLAFPLFFLLSFQTRQDPMAGKILDEVGKRYQKLKGFSAEFTHESENNAGETKGSLKGKITVSGSKYRLISGNTTLICDGKVVWSADKKTKEVTISDYEPEPDDITPERIYTFYQKGYKYMFMGEVKTKTGTWQSIDLEPENIQKEVSKIRLFVAKQNRSIMKWIVYERGSNDREVFEVTKFLPLTQIQASDFVFSKAQFPGYKVVDLR
jgi:outer membrane lipoprotein carrier protein